MYSYCTGLWYTVAFWLWYDLLWRVSISDTSCHMDMLSYILQTNII